MLAQRCGCNTRENNFKLSDSFKGGGWGERWRRDYFTHFYSCFLSLSQSHIVSPPPLCLFSSMRLEARLKNAITLVLMCNTFQISPLLAERIETNCSLPPSPAHFYLWRDEDTQLRGAVLEDEEQGDATHRFPFSPPTPTSQYQVLPSSSLFCDQSLLLRVRVCSLDGLLVFLSNTNKSQMISRILTETNFKCTVSCYQ